MSHRTQQAICALVCACLLVNTCAQKDADDDYVQSIYMWDLNVDPLETNNVYGDPAYADQQAYLEGMVTTWQGNAIECDNKYTSGTYGDIYGQCGGICPNITENFYKLDVQQKYSASNPPNIVFLLADDWGWNDVGFRSTYMDWATPNIDSFVAGGIKLDNYFTHYYCAPSRAALLTGRQAMRLGMIDVTEGCELPLTETLIAQEMQSAGYRTYMVGKWHMGSSSYAATPLYRGFDEFYGFYSGFIDYETKFCDLDFLDLQDGMHLETDPAILDSDYHSAYLFQSKAEKFIAEHATDYADTPMFLYYAIQLVHYPYTVPSTYSDRCGDIEYAAYCGLNLMLDEVVSNTTCALEAAGLLDNTVIILATDNGGNHMIPGDSFPYRGYKYDQFRGGISGNAFIFSPLLDESLRGTSYAGQMHITDWLPTLMHVATDGAWTGSYTGATLDGVNMWDAIMSNLTTPRSELVHYASLESTHGSVQKDMIKYDYLQDLPDFGIPSSYFPTDLYPDYASYQCDVDELSINGADEDLAALIASYNYDGHDGPARRGSGHKVQTVGAGAGASRKSSSDYLMWLFGAGLLVGLMMFLSRRNVKVDEKYIPINHDAEIFVTDANLESGKLSAYQKSLN